MFIFVNRLTRKIQIRITETKIILCIKLTYINLCVKIKLDVMCYLWKFESIFKMK